MKIVVSIALVSWLVLIAVQGISLLALYGLLPMAPLLAPEELTPAYWLLILLVALAGISKRFGLIIDE